MARLASLVKGGYYPLSDLNTLAVSGLIRPADTEPLHNNDYYTRRPYTLLDPFCGEGVAVAALGRKWNAAAYGVELHPERCAAAQDLLGKEQVHAGPAEGLMSSGFDIVYANPPYDNLSEVGLTLVAAAHVQPGGLLVTVLPEKATVRVLEALTGADGQLFSTLFARWAPDPEWKQVVAVLKRERYDYYAEKWEPAPFEPWSPPDKPFEPDVSRFHPRGEALVETFKMRRIEKLLDTAKDIAAATDVLTLVTSARAEESDGLRPLTALRPGHLAALLASGLLNQVEVEVDGRRLALKGTTEYVVERSIEVKGEKQYAVERKSPQASLAVLDLDTGEIEKMTPANERFAEVLHAALPALLERLEADVKPVFTGCTEAERRLLAQVRSPHPEVTNGLLPSQMETAAALVAGLQNDKAAVLIGEMGSGKTITSLGSWHLLRRGKSGSKLVIVAPPHLVKKWQREAALALPYAVVTIAQSIGDVDAAMNATAPAVLVMSHEVAKRGSGWRSTATRLEHLKLDRCPTCGRPVEVGEKKVKCPECETPLWEQRPLASGAGKYPLAEYLRRRCRGRYDLILDEIQDYKALSQRGQAAYSAIVGAQKVLALTGTFYGGKSSSVFYLFYRLFADFRRAYDWRAGLGEFIAEFGSVEIKTSANDEEYGANWTYKRKQSRTDEVPGVSPGIISWALPHTVFLGLKDVAPDLSAALPDYQEHIHLVRMNPQMRGQYAQLKRMREAGIAEFAEGSASLFSAWLYAALGWPDNPTTDVVHDGYTWLDGLDIEAGEKERAIVDLAAEEVANGRPVAIYVGQVHKRDPAAFLKPLLEAHGLSVEILTTDVPPTEREEWLEKRQSDVLIVNPSLVQTGLDLIRYAVIIFDGIPNFSTYVLQQAARRSWRIGQDKPVTVHYFAYSGTLQDDALQLIAEKAAAATAFNGEELEALAAFGDSSGDLLSSLRERVLSTGAETSDESGDWLERIMVGETVVIDQEPANGAAWKPVMLGENADAYDYLPPEVRAALPPLYSTDGQGVDAVAQVKYFTPDSSWTWYATELDPATGECFGLVVGHDIELGYFSLAEFAEVRGHLGLKVERDLWFKPTPVRDLVEMHRDDSGVMHCAVHVDAKAMPVDEPACNDRNGKRPSFGELAVTGQGKARKRTRKAAAAAAGVQQLSFFDYFDASSSDEASEVGEGQQLALFG